MNELDLMIVADLERQQHAAMRRAAREARLLQEAASTEALPAGRFKHRLFRLAALSIPALLLIVWVIAR